MAWYSLDDDWAPRIARMERLGASIEELAKETLESIMGYQGKGGHKPARPDIQKMKDAWDLHDKTLPPNSPYENTPEAAVEREAAQKEWAEKYGLDHRDQLIVGYYKRLLAHGEREVRTPQGAFEAVARLVSNLPGMGAPDVQPINDYQVEYIQSQPEQYPITPEAKQIVGNALKKYEQQNWPMLYSTIGNALDDAYRRGPHESYKLWPRMVSWIKDDFQAWLQFRNHTLNRENQAPGPLAENVRHIIDVTTEGGAILSQLRAENKIPQGMDVNKLSFKDFEDWLMQWKHENRASETQGQVVYKFHDDWTIQKLTTAEQLQFEGDEMGHCVGGYADSVEEGETIIYSLRDPKGIPHVTMEIEAQQGLRLREDGYRMECIHPDQHEPGQHLQQTGWDGRGDSAPITQGKSGEKAFEVVQVQGNSNQSPKPEYQRKIKEFLDALRAKGWRFKRSDGWYAPHDEDEYGNYAERIENAGHLDDWYDDDYKALYERYQKGGEDAYGLNSDRKRHSVTDWQKLIEECCASLVDDYDRDRWKTRDWQGLAQAVWHAWWLDAVRESGRDEAELKRDEANFVQTLEKAEQELQEWVWGHMDFAINDYFRELVAEEIKNLAEKDGTWERIEETVDELLEGEEYSGNGSFDDELYEWVERNEPDLFEEARGEVEGKEADEYAGDAYHFLGYLFNLVHHVGGVSPEKLPNPNDPHGGLPSYEDLTRQNGQQQLTAEPEIDKGIPGALSSWNKIAHDIQIFPIDQEHNQWFDEEGNQRERWRPGWAKDPATGKMRQTGELEDSFLDKQGRQGEGWVAYHGDRPIGSLTYVDTPVSNMIGTTYVHPDYREQGIFNRLAEPLRSNGKPTDAYVWNNPWLKNKVRSWGT